jgi:LacI family transcriptional regulator
VSGPDHAAPENGGPARRRPTVTDVARAAGVSVATAGRVLGGYGNVGPDLRTQVQAAADALGYSPNVVARSMRSGSTGSIGFVGADISNAFFAAAMRGLCDVAREEGCEPILANSDDSVDVERNAVQVFVAKQIDGLVVSPTSVTDVEHLKHAQDQGVPVVLLDRHSSALHADSVVVDNEAAARQAVTHLLDLGHRDIGLLAMTDLAEGPEITRHPKTGQVDVRGASRPSVERIRGYVLAMQDAGLVVRDDLIAYTPGLDPADAEREADRLLGQSRRPTAVFAADNIATQAAFTAARRHGLRMPDDVSLVGFDDLDWTSLVDPPVTVVAQSPTEMGRIAARILFDRIKGGEAPPDCVVLPTQLLVRGSTARLA